MTKLDVEIPIERLHELFALDYTTGQLVWRRRVELTQWDKTANSKYAGKAAGTLDKAGYVQIIIGGRGGFRTYAHRVVFAMVNGRWPKDEVDHRFGERSDNRPGEIREATRAEQCQNMKTRSDNKSGFTGVCWHPKTKKWRARIKVNGKYHSLGLFVTKEDANEAYLESKSKLHLFQPTKRVS